MSTENENPYAAPITDPIPVTPLEGNLQLATLSERFAGAFMDGLVNVVIMLPIWVILYFVGVIHAFADISKLGFGFTLLVTVVSYAVFLGINWKFLNATGQTIGKKIAKTRIVTMNGEKPAINDLAFKRYAFFNLLGLLPMVGGIASIVNICFIFRKDRRCIHDLIAKTQVVKAPPAK